MTQRLYYDDAYLTEFRARVLELREDENGFFARLDRSAFYPTSGGQPYDTGTLGGARVLDVFSSSDGEVWHRLSQALTAGETVRGDIDWARRFDHMQQHAGEHMLANALYRLENGRTIGLHLGAAVSTIDVDLPGGAMRLPDRALFALEDDVNARVQADAPIRCWFPSEEELSRLPLRKAPTVSSNVRVVQIGDVEFCACGGTHPSSTGQIGLVKIVDARPSKGKMRVSFLCGMRAFRDYRARMTASDAAAETLSTGWENLPGAVGALLERERLAQTRLAAMGREAALAQVPDMLTRATEKGGARVVSALLPDTDIRTLREVAAALVKNRGVVALLALPSDAGVQLLFARAADAPGDMGRLLSECAAAFGGKGGGKADFAQGAAKDTRALEMALTKILC